VSSFLTL